MKFFVCLVPFTFFGLAFLRFNTENRYSLFWTAYRNRLSGSLSFKTHFDDEYRFERDREKEKKPLNWKEMSDYCSSCILFLLTPSVSKPVFVDRYCYQVIINYIAYYSTNSLPHFKFQHQKINVYNIQ